MNTSPPRLIVACRLGSAVACIAVLFLAVAPRVARAQPGANEAAWGPAKSGLRARLTLPAEVVPGGKIAFTCELQNASTQAMPLKPKEIFGWLFVIQQAGQAKAAVFTDKIPLAGDIPPELKGLATRTQAGVDATGARVYAYTKGLSVVGGHPAPADGSALKPVGTLSEKLLVGPAKVRLMLYVPRAGDRAVLLVSNTVDLKVAPPKMADLDPAARKEFVAQLLATYKRSAFGGMKAHDQAVRIGPSVAPDLIEALKDPKLPDFAKAWMCTSVCRLHCPESVRALLGYMKDRPDLRAYIVYHGPSQKDDELDKAIIARVVQSGPIHLAVLGFLGARGRVPEEIMQAGLDSKDPRIRGTVAEAFSKVASDENVLRAMNLLKDKDAKVRAVAARVLGLMVTGSHERARSVCRGLVGVLDDPSEYVRQRACDALSRIAGRDMPYDPKASPARRGKVVKAWKDWWAGLQSGR